MDIFVEGVCMHVCVVYMYMYVYVSVYLGGKEEGLYCYNVILAPKIFSCIVVPRKDFCCSSSRRIGKEKVFNKIETDWSGGIILCLGLFGFLLLPLVEFL